MPAKSVGQGFVRVWCCFELLELLVEGAEVLFVVLVKVDDLSGTGARDGAAPGAGARCAGVLGASAALGAAAAAS